MARVSVMSGETTGAAMRRNGYLSCGRGETRAAGELLHRQLLEHCPIRSDHFRFSSGGAFLPQGARRTETRSDGSFRAKSSEKPLDRILDTLIGLFPILVTKCLRRNDSSRSDNALDDDAERQSEMSLDGFFDLIGLGIRSLIGFGVFFGLIFWAFNVQAKMWRALVERYGQAKKTPVLARKIPETIVIYDITIKGWQLGGRPKYQTYFGTIISVLEDGLLISAMPPINFIDPYRDIYLPFDEMDIETYPWMLWHQPYAITMDKTPNLKVIISQDTVQWLRQNTGRAPFHR